MRWANGRAFATGIERRSRTHQRIRARIVVAASPACRRPLGETGRRVPVGGISYPGFGADGKSTSEIENVGVRLPSSTRERS